MAADETKTVCNGFFVFRVVDTVALVVAVVLQGLALDHFLVTRLAAAQKLFYLFYVADGFLVVVLVVTSVISYKNLLGRFHDRIAHIDIPQISVPTYGVLPFGYIAWMLYAALITVKLVFFIDRRLDDHMPANGFEGGLLSSSVFKIVLAASSVVFVLLVNTHHDAEPQSMRSAYIADLCKSTTFDIMDSVAFLTTILPEYDLPASYRVGPLRTVILVFSCINLFLPTLALMRLSLSDFCQAGHPFRLELLYKTGRLLFIDLPYMSVRIHLWHVDRSVSLFLVKNMLYVLISLRYLIPEYVAVVRHGRRIAAAADGEVLPTTGSASSKVIPKSSSDDEVDGGPNTIS